MIRRLVAAGVAALAVSLPAFAQDYPTKPIKLVVPFPPAGGTDVLSRAVAHSVATDTRWTIVVENKPGAGGTIGHIGGELFQRRAGIKMTHVPYKGAGPVVTDLLGGNVDCFFGNSQAVGALVNQGKLRALAVTAPRRLKGFPEIPTVAEQGYAGFEAATWSGLVAPAGTPQPIVDKLNAKRGAAVREAGIKLD